MNTPNRMPPQDIEPSDLWSQIMTMPRAHRVVDLPIRGEDDLPIGKVAIVVLDGDEVEAANLNADKFVRAKYKKIAGEVPKHDEVVGAYNNVSNARATREILLRCCKRAHACITGNDGVCRENHGAMAGFFPTIDAIGKLTTDEQAVLMRHYLQTQSEVGPITKIMSQDEMDAWLEMLAKGGRSDPLAFLSSEDAIRLLMHSASRLYPSPTDIDSAGMPQSENEIDN